MSRLSIRPIIYLHLLIVTLVLSAFFVSAQPGDLSPQAAERAFTLDPASPVDIPNLRVRMIKDPERGDVLKIEEAGSHGGHGRPGLEAYVIEVDEQKGTYKVTPVDPATVEPPEWRLDPQAYPGSTHQPPVLIPASYVGLYRVAIVSYWAGLTVVTMDQANLHLAATKNLLYWTGDTTAGRVLNGTAGRDIFAANPSPAGTRWFVNNIQDGGIAQINTFPYGMVPQHALTVTYENWNFGNEFKATYTRHKTSIWGDPNGTAWCWWDWERWGEGASLLKVAVLHSHS